MNDPKNVIVLRPMVQPRDVELLRVCAKVLRELGASLDAATSGDLQAAELARLVDIVTPFGEELIMVTRRVRRRERV